MLKIFCQYEGVDVDFSEKKLECFQDIIDDDEDFVIDYSLPIDEQLKQISISRDKYDSFISGEEVNFGGWICKLVEVIS